MSKERKASVRLTYRISSMNKCGESGRDLMPSVVIEATIRSNQSERSKNFLDQSESRISPMWLIDVTNAHIWAWFYTWPHGIKNTRTQELNPHSWHSFNDRVKPWVQAGRRWRPSDVTPIFTLIHEIKIRCLLLGGRSHEQGMRPWNIMVVTCVWPWFD